MTPIANRQVSSSFGMVEVYHLYYEDLSATPTLATTLYPSTGQDALRGKLEFCCERLVMREDLLGLHDFRKILKRRIRARKDSLASVYGSRTLRYWSSGHLGRYVRGSHDDNAVGSITRTTDHRMWIQGNRKIIQVYTQSLGAQYTGVTIATGKGEIELQEIRGLVQAPDIPRCASIRRRRATVSDLVCWKALCKIELYRRFLLSAISCLTRVPFRPTGASGGSSTSELPTWSVQAD
jgi:hypothetical protein